jgi:hypothetical protein
MGELGSRDRVRGRARLVRFFPALLAAAMLQATPASAAQIGVAAIVQNEVTGIIAGKSAPIAVGNQIFSDQRIQTGTNGTAQFLFADQSVFTIGPKSDLVLDRFVYDPANGGGNLTLETTKGAFRFISGTQTAESYKIQTPVATIGIRGSMVLGVGTPTGFLFYTGEGLSYVIPNGKPIIDNIPAGRAVLILDDGRVIETKFDVGQLDLTRLQQLLPLFEEFPDRFQDIADQNGALHAPVCSDSDRYSEPAGPNNDEPDCD